jgi:hypothetical protein
LPRSRKASVKDLEAHWPSLTDTAEEELWDRLRHLYRDDVDIADLALRECHCGARIDGFDEYLFHLKEVLFG